MRRSKFLINDVRRDTENEGEVTGEAGISDEAILQAINDGQTWLFSELERVQPLPFTEEAFLNLVAGDDTYALPTNTYLGSDIVSISCARNSGATSYDRLQLISLHERIQSTLQRGTPTRYYLRQNQIILNPVPQSSVTNGIKVNYTKRLPRVDKRRAKVESVTVTSGQVTALTVADDDWTEYFPGEAAFAASRILIDDYFCIVDKDGTIKARRIPITAISATGVATLTSYTPEYSTDTAAIGDYLVAGSYASSHSLLPDESESFLIQFAKSQVFENDGNREEGETSAVRAKLVGETVVNGWKKLCDDIEFIPIINPNNL